MKTLIRQHGTPEIIADLDQLEKEERRTGWIKLILQVLITATILGALAALMRDVLRLL